MSYRSRFTRIIAGTAALFTLLLVQVEPAEAQSAGEIAGCITDAWDEYVECIDDLPWWAEMLCAARFSADVILCAPKIILDAAK